ncbi:sulfotransferase [Streptomyces fodineus]|uniref:MmyB family transcriptional regulator n=1 Tax=Streptomyces fodineus TaxID=1904616 RepID=UPI00131BCB09|nr:sulfotransferase [Streptomyces fodineus]
MGVTEKIENDRMRPSPDLYLRIAASPGFSTHDLRLGHLDLCGLEPPPAVNTSSPHLQRVVDGQREMMCVVAPDGRLVARNAAFSAMFDDEGVPENFWRWALLSDCARDAVLVDWEKDWAPYLLEECRLLFFRYRDHAAVRRLYADLTDDLRLQSLPRVGTDINGRAGSLRHRQNGTRRVHILAAESEGCRLLTFLTESA